MLALLVAAIAGAQIALDPSPARVAGHQPVSPPEELVVSTFSPNFSASGGLFGPYGVALDTSTSPPILYVSDTYNNRVLAWKNATSSTLANLQAPDMVIGQPNAYTTLPSINGGLRYPTGLAVDSSGNLYVVDSGNNRILRYPKPLVNGGATPDIVLGQPDRFTSTNPNQGTTPSAKTLCLYLGCPRGSGVFVTALVFDSSGNLFVTDAGNGRVLRYPAGSLTSGAVDPAADSVIGQVSFTATTNPSGPTDKTYLNTPAGVAIDFNGHLFVSDNAPRVVVYPTSSLPANGITAIGFAGIVNPAPATPTASTLNDPSGIVMVNNGPAVVDTGYNRILFFDPFSSPDWGTTPAALAVLGQGSSLTNFSSTAANAGNPQASFTDSSGNVFATLNTPVSAAVGTNGDLFVTDVQNNRVLVFPSAGTVASATEVLGQTNFPYSSPNSIHGKEFYFGSQLTNSYDAGMAVDASSGTPHLYVSDPNNNRVLGFNDARKVAAGVAADIVIGEPDLYTSVCNFGGVTNPSTEALPRQPTNASLCYPTGLAVDTDGNLYVADTSNGRVLRFPQPFNPSNSAMTANLVLGQTAFTGVSNPQAGRNITAAPYGLLFDANNGLFVSDESANRVLLFPIDSSTSSGEQAATVFGQTTFDGTDNTVFSSPHHIAEDSIGELYVADSGHNQILIFDIQPGATSVTQPIDSFTGFNYPEAIWVNSSKVAGYRNDIWVGDSSGLSRFSPPNVLVSGGAPTLTMPIAEVAGPSVTCNGQLCEYPAIAITQDNYGDLYVADTSNRVSIHYPGMAAQNSGSYVCYMGCTLGKENIPCLTVSSGYNVSCGMAPGTYTTLYPNPANFAFLASGSSAAYASSLPLPTALAGLQVLVNGVPSPLSVITPPSGTYLGQINFLVPYEAPTSSTAQVIVWNPATSQILASGDATMADSSPGFFTNNGGGTGQIAALNCNNYKTGCENTRNGPSNTANPGAPIQLFLNGAGADFNGTLPPDGAGSSGTLPTKSVPEVYIGSSLAQVDYSGLAPGIPGLWQINVTIPQNPVDLGGFEPSSGQAPTTFPVQILYEGLAISYAQNNGNPSVAPTISITPAQ